MDLVTMIGNFAESTSAEIIENLQKRITSTSNENNESSAQSIDSKNSWSLGSLSSGVYPGTEDLIAIENQLQTNQPIGVRLNAVQVIFY